MHTSEHGRAANMGKTEMNRTNGERGAVLVVSLMILLIMTIIGITAMRTTTMEEKMAGNSLQRALAFQAAEAGLRDGEDWVDTNITKPSDLGQFDGTNGLYSQRDPVALPFDIYTESNWTGSGTSGTDIDGTGGQPPPKYIVEYMGRVGEAPLCVGQGCPPDVRDYAFRVTAIGWGADTTAKQMLWSTFRLRLN